MPFRAVSQRLFVQTFAAVFLAELGDKTQLATLSLASESSSRWVVFSGSATALVTSSAIAVLGGDFVAKWIPAVWVQRASGALFLVMGVLILLQSRGHRAP